MRIVHLDRDVLAYVRETPEERLLVVVAREAVGLVTFTVLSWGFKQMDHVFGFDAALLVDGQISVTVDSAGGGIWRLT
jgi:hypothetical protein